MIFEKFKRSLPWEKRSGGIEISCPKNNMEDGQFQLHRIRRISPKIAGFTALLTGTSKSRRRLY
jgi:hypothetical protein